MDVGNGLKDRESPSLSQVFPPDPNNNGDTVVQEHNSTGTRAPAYDTNSTASSDSLEESPRIEEAPSPLVFHKFLNFPSEVRLKVYEALFEDAKIALIEHPLGHPLGRMGANSLLHRRLRSYSSPLLALL